MKKKSKLHKTINSAFTTTIERFSKLKPTDRFAVFEEMGEWIFYEYDELEIDYLKHISNKKKIFIWILRTESQKTVLRYDLEINQDID